MNEPVANAQAHGALERVGPAEVLAATSGVRAGSVYDLGLEIGPSMPQGPHPDLVPFSLMFTCTPERSASPDMPFTVAMEAVIGALHTSTHLDAFVHAQRDGRIFGGEDAADVRGDSGFSRYGAETIRPIVTRGIVLDVAREHGARRLPDGYEITVADLQAALAAARLDVRRGDAVLVRTGKIQQFHADPDGFSATQPGVGPDAAIWLYEQGMAVLGTDTSGTEAIPFPSSDRSTHVEMLVERGVHLIESLNLEDVGSDDVASGLFVCLPLPITGATGSWVRPVLIT
jgi:kynurenine formamidase